MNSKNSESKFDTSDNFDPNIIMLSLKNVEKEYPVTYSIIVENEIVIKQ